MGKRVLKLEVVFFIAGLLGNGQRSPEVGGRLLYRSLTKECAISNRQAYSKIVNTFFAALLINVLWQ